MQRFQKAGRYLYKIKVEHEYDLKILMQCSQHQMGMQAFEGSDLLLPEIPFLEEKE